MSKLDAFINLGANLFKGAAKLLPSAEKDAAKYVKKQQLIEAEEKIKILAAEKDEQAIAAYLKSLPKEMRESLKGNVGYIEGIRNSYRSGGLIKAAPQAIIGIPLLGKIALIGFIGYEGLERIPQLFWHQAAANQQQAVQRLYANNAPQYQGEGPLGQVEGWLKYEKDYLLAGWGHTPTPPPTQLGLGPLPAAANGRIKLPTGFNPDNPQDLNAYLAQVQAQNGLEIKSTDSPARKAAKAQAVESIATAQAQAYGEQLALPLIKNIKNETAIKQQLYDLTRDPDVWSGQRPTPQAFRESPYVDGALNSLSDSELTIDPLTSLNVQQSKIAAIQKVVDAVKAGHISATAEVLAGEQYSVALHDVLTPQFKARDAMGITLNSGPGHITPSSIRVQVVRDHVTAFDMEHGITLRQNWNQIPVNPPPGYLSVQESPELSRELDTTTNSVVSLPGGKRFKEFVYSGDHSYEQGKAAWSTNSIGQIVVAGTYDGKVVFELASDYVKTPGALPLANDYVYGKPPEFDSESKRVNVPTKPVAPSFSASSGGSRPATAPSSLPTTSTPDRPHPHQQGAANDRLPPDGGHVILASYKPGVGVKTNYANIGNGSANSDTLPASTGMAELGGSVTGKFALSYIGKLGVPFAAESVPVLGGIVAAGATTVEVGDNMFHGRWGAAGVAFVAGVANTLCCIFIPIPAVDALAGTALHEAIEDGAARLWGKSVTSSWSFFGDQLAAQRDWSAPPSRPGAHGPAPVGAPHASFA